MRLNPRADPADGTFVKVNTALRASFAVFFAFSCAFAPVATAAPGIDLGLGGVKLPQIDLPTVKPPSLGSDGIKAPSVDLEPTVNSAVGVVNEITGNGSRGGSSSSGTASSGNTATPSTPGTPSTPSAPVGSGSQPPSSSQSIGSSKSAKPASGSKSSGLSPASSSSGKQGDAASGGSKKAGQGRPSGNGSSEPGKTANSQPSTFIQVVQAFSWTLFGVLIAFALIALGMTGRSATLARLTRKLKQQRGELTDDVGAMQTALLPTVPATIGDTSFSVAYRSAGPASGGDFHDVVELDGGRTAILVGDACGHGREALHTTALVHYTVRAYLEAGLQPRDAIRLADEKVGGKLGGDFVTVLCAIYDPSTSSLSYATAGHPAPFVVGGPGDQAISLLTDPPIGVGSPSGNRQTRISIPDGCQVCFFSDGLSEGRLADGELIGRPGLIGELEAIGAAADAGAAMESLMQKLSTDDDTTLLTLHPSSPRGSTRVTEYLELDSHVAALGELRYFLTAAGLDSHQAQRTQTEAVHRTKTRPAHLRVHRGGDGETQWEFTGSAPAEITPEGPAPHLELVLPERAGVSQPVG